MEVWKPIIGFENLYEASNIGRIRNLKNNRILHGSRIESKYVKYILYKNGIRYYELGHRLIAEAFIPNPENLPQVNHINGRKADNRVNNLEWCTAKDNMIHAIKTGLRKPAYGCKSVQNITTGQIFESAMAAARSVKQELPNSNTESIMKNIKRCCSGKRPTAYKYQWKNI